jgi:hypothetical protein
LLEFGVPVNLSVIDKVELVTPSGYVISSKTDPGLFKWQNTPALGVLELFLGRLGRQSPFYEEGTYECELVIFDDLNWRGALWGIIRLMVV